MSAYMTLMTPMTDRACLLAALADLGFDASKVEVHEEPVHLRGFMGEARAQVADVVIRRQHVGGSSNDVGFVRTSTGYQAVVSSYDQGRYGERWLNALHGRYLVHLRAQEERAAAEERRRLEEARQKLVEAQRQAVHARAKKMGYRVQEKREGEVIRMVLVRRSYS